MTREELDIQKEIEKYFTESTGFGRDKIANFMDIVNKALKQKGKRIEELERKLEQTEKDLADYQFNYPTIKELEKQVKDLEWQLQEVVKDNDYYQAENNKLLDVINNQDVKIADLEKKNKELKDELEKAEEKINILDNCDRLGDVITDAYKQQLAKATDIIKGLLSCCRNYPQENAEKMKQAEQFIKDMEK